MWQMKVKVIVRAQGIVTPQLEKWLQQTPGTISGIPIQKRALLGLAKILSITFNLPGFW